MRINENIVREAEVYVRDYLGRNLPALFCYHDIGHTTRVARQTQVLCDVIGVDRHERVALLTAAWFHDSGYAESIDDHEKFGALQAEQFLSTFDIDHEEIELVKSLIHATRYPQQPNSKLEKILCDADMLHLAADDFGVSSELLRREWVATRGLRYTDEEWSRLSYDFVSSHRFQTKFCRRNFTAGKEANRKKLKKSIKEADKAVSADASGKKSAKYVKGVETLFRNSSRNHMELSAMADTKAHILLSVSSVIISVIISFVFQQLTTSSFLILPTVLLVTVCLATIVLAVLTTKPKISSGYFTGEQVNKHEVNLLFFGNFYKMDLPSYERSIEEMMKDKEYLYGSMIKDLYFLGKVLSVKYRYLRIGYHIFMYGIIASVFTFGLSFILSSRV